MMTLAELRRSSRVIWTAALDAADPEASVRRALRATPNGMVVEGQSVDLSGRLVVVGAGKAGARMARAAESILGDRISDGLVITKYGHRLPTRTIRIHEAGHPVPDETGRAGVDRLRRLLTGLSAEDVVLCLISGGGSALLPAPADDISLVEKGRVTELLLTAGATIRDLNAVRKHISEIKGGQLVRWAAPASVVSLVMSDVIGDPLDCIASGPTSPDASTFSDALDVLSRYQIDAPRSIVRRLESGVAGRIAETPKPGDRLFDRVSNHVIASNRLLVEAARTQAQGMGFQTIVLSSAVEGEARDVGRLYASIGREIAAYGDPVPSPACVLSGGETTVHVRGPGAGGRNMEMALACALAMNGWGHTACFASIASDGTDGPTDAAGGLVDPTTCRRASALGLDAAACLAANDSLTFLDGVGDIVRTGPTQTNLMDLQILLVERDGAAGPPD